MTTRKAKDLEQVKEHYNKYPYPPRNPENEKNTLTHMLGDSLYEINHYLFKGQQNFEKGFRVLIAGGGTGDSTVFLAEQLKDVENAEVVYLDFSKNSMNIAQQRVKNRGMNIEKDVTWINDSILNIPKLNLGKFDFIQCSGVLYHLESPDDGLRILSDSLKKIGGMKIMVYGLYGRTGVYQIQELLRMVNKGVNSCEEEINNSWKIINNLPDSNWFQHSKEWIPDYMFGDAGMYDMFLHKQDRAYSIPELYQFLTTAGLHLIQFTDPISRIHLKPETHIKDPELLEKILKMDNITQQAICEIISGNIYKHSFYASKDKDTVADFTDLDNVLYFYDKESTPVQIVHYLEKNNFIGGYFTFSRKNGNVTMTIPVSEYTKYVFKGMTGGTKSFKEIFREVEEGVGQKIPLEELNNEVQKYLPLFNEAGELLLRNKNTHFPDIVSR